MLHLELPEREYFDGKQNLFVTVPAMSLQMEHSLVSLSKWESKYKKPFLSPLDKHKKTAKELSDYIRMMVINRVDFDILTVLSTEDINKIQEYISDPHTATTIPQGATRGGPVEIVTSELVYYWMVSLGIPFEAQHWHLNSLLTLIQVINYKNKTPEKKGHQELANERRELNAQRRKMFASEG